MKKTVFSFILTFLYITSLFAAPKAVVFDFGGVLTSDPNREAVVSFICQSLNLSEQEFKKANEEKHQHLSNDRTDEEFWIQYAEKNGITLASNWRESFRNVLKEAIATNPQMFLLVDQLKKEPITVALLSNVGHRLAKMVHEAGFYAPFEPCLLSCDIGIEKPNPGAYEHLLKCLDMPAADVVFIDDRLENVESAKTVGIDAIHFLSEDQLRKELQERGLLVVN